MMSGKSFLSPVFLLFLVLSLGPKDSGWAQASPSSGAAEDAFPAMIRDFQITLSELAQQKKLTCKQQKGLLALSLGFLVLRKALALDEPIPEWNENKNIDGNFPMAYGVYEMIKRELNRSAQDIAKAYQIPDYWKRYRRQFVVHLLNLVIPNFVGPDQETDSPEPCYFKKLPFDYKVCEPPKQNTMCSCKETPEMSRSQFLVSLVTRPIQIDQKGKGFNPLDLDLELKYLTILRKNLEENYPDFFKYILPGWDQRDKAWTGKVKTLCTQTCEAQPDMPTTTVVYHPLCEVQKSDEPQAFSYPDDKINVLGIDKKTCVDLLKFLASRYLTDPDMEQLIFWTCKTNRELWMCGPFSWVALNNQDFLMGDCGLINLCYCAPIKNKWVQSLAHDLAQKLSLTPIEEGRLSSFGIHLEDVVLKRFSPDEIYQKIQDIQQQADALSVPPDATPAERAQIEKQKEKLGSLFKKLQPLLQPGMDVTGSGLPPNQSPMCLKETAPFQVFYDQCKARMEDLKKADPADANLFAPPPENQVPK